MRSETMAAQVTELLTIEQRQSHTPRVGDWLSGARSDENRPALYLLCGTCGL